MRKRLLLILTLILAVACSAKEETLNTQTTLNVDTGETSTKNQVKSIEEIKEDKLDGIISGMSIEEKVGQIFFVAYRKDKNRKPYLSVDDDLIESILKYNPGGVVLFGENIDTAEQTKSFIREMQSNSKIPLLIGVDEEGGRVSRLHASGKIDTVLIPAAEKIGFTGNPSAAYDAGKSIGADLKSLGFTVDFAPVCDLNTNPKNKVIGSRSFGKDAELAGEMVKSMTEGLKSENINACLKHFPGHGDTINDTHTGEAIAYHDLERLTGVEFVPFQSGIDAGAEFVMISHIKLPNVQKEVMPASLSKEIIDLLKYELGFSGIIITDALDMGAITKFYTSGETALNAFNAGVDMLLMPENLDEAFNVIVKNVKSGVIPESRLDDSVRKILALKLDML